MKNWYIQVSKSWAAQYNGYTAGLCQLCTATTIDGRTVVSINALAQFPDIFEGAVNRVPVLLSAADFAQEVTGP